MFSLIITIISIALVAALALATLYYGGSAFNQSSSKVEASKLLAQGQQLTGASELFHAREKAWPVDIGELVSKNYLKSIPSSHGVPWEMTAGSPPYFTLKPVSDLNACAFINQSGSLGKNGVLTTAHEEFGIQCYGANKDALRVVVNRNSTAGSLAALPSAEIATEPVPTSPTDSAWLKAPGVIVGTPGGEAGPGQLTWPSATSHDFAAVPVNSSVSHTFTFTNTSAQQFFIDLVGIGYYDPDFSATNNNCYPLAAASSCTFTVTYHPSTAGAHSAPVSFNVGGQPSVAALITGSAVDGAVSVSVDTPSLAFTDTEAGGTRVMSLQLTNTGTAPLTLVRALDTEYPYGALVFSATTGNCTNIPAGGTCTIPVTFKPTSAVIYSDTLNLTFQGSSDVTSVSLSGTGTASPNYVALKYQGATIGGTTYDGGLISNLGLFSLGTMSWNDLAPMDSYDIASLVFTVKNQSTKSMDYWGSEAYAYHGRNVSSAQPASVGEGTTCSGVLTPGQECVIQVNFSVTQASMDAALSFGFLAPYTIPVRVQFTTQDTDGAQHFAWVNASYTLVPLSSP